MLLRPAQQRQPARAGLRLHRAAARARQGRGRRPPGRREGLLLRPDRRLRPEAGRRDHPERGLRAGHHRPVLHATRTRPSSGPTASTTPSPPRCGPRTTARAMRMSKTLDFGCVWINTHIPLVAEMPHGGFKKSGYGKDLSGVRLRGLHADQARDDVAGRLSATASARPRTGVDPSGAARFPSVVVGRRRRNASTGPHRRSRRPDRQGVRCTRPARRSVDCPRHMSGGMLRACPDSEDALALPSLPAARARRRRRARRPRRLRRARRLRDRGRPARSPTGPPPTSG